MKKEEEKKKGEMNGKGREDLREMEMMVIGGIGRKVKEIKKMKM
ncbi:hypothetical protein [Staphylococcus auricularis]|nr:hypothetical protein [Staphylococcus auricularis]